MKTVLGVVLALVILCVLNVFFEEAHAYETHCYKSMGVRYCESY
jgi:hypothetical protein